MKSKEYSKPELKTRKIELGVFGTYSDGKRRRGHGGTHDIVPAPLDNIDGLNLHME